MTRVSSFVTVPYPKFLALDRQNFLIFCELMLWNHYSTLFKTSPRFLDNDSCDVLHQPCQIRIYRPKTKEVVAPQPQMVLFELDDERQQIRFQVESNDDTEAKFFIGKRISGDIEIHPDLQGHLELTVPSIRLTFDKAGSCTKLCALFLYILRRKFRDWKNDASSRIETTGFRRCWYSPRFAMLFLFGSSIDSDNIKKVHFTPQFWCFVWFENFLQYWEMCNVSSRTLRQKWSSLSHRQMDIRRCLKFIPTHEARSSWQYTLGSADSRSKHVWNTFRNSCCRFFCL